MAAVPAEPPHLVQLEIRRTFLSGSPTRRPSPPHNAPLARTGQAQAGDVVDLALEGRRDRMGNAPERREEAVSPPPNIYLGETYTANVHLSVPANAAPHAAHKVHLVVEMHSGIPPLATRTAGTPPPPPAPQVRQYPLSSHDFERIDPSPRAAEIVVPLEWELKELGSHAVVCLVSYGVQVADRETGELQLVMRSYRKILRFEVLNPLSVRTKAHAPSSPSFSPNTFYSPLARRKLFLEVQVQNHCDSRMTFQRMRFDPVEEFHVSEEAKEGFVVPAPGPTKDESAVQHQPQQAGLDFLPLATGSVRQFLYILTRSSSTRLSDPVAGAAQDQQQQQQQEPLGRLDIVWQTESGQRGRLQSATLGRKLPPPPPPPPSSGPTLSPDPRPGTGTERLTASSSSSPVLSRTGSGAGGGIAPSDFRNTLDEVQPIDLEGLKFDVVVEAVFPSPPLRSDTTTTTTTTTTAAAAAVVTAAASRSTFLVNEAVSVRLRIRVARDKHHHHQVLSNLTTTTTIPRHDAIAGTSVDRAAAESIAPPSSPRGGPRRRRVRAAVQHVQWHASPIRDQPPPLRHSTDDDDGDGVKAGDHAGRSTFGLLGHGRTRERVVPSSFGIPGAMPSNDRTMQQLPLPGVTSLQQQQSLLAAARNNNNGGAEVFAAAAATAPVVGGKTLAPLNDADADADADEQSRPMMHGVRLPLPIPTQPPPPGPVPSAEVIRLGPDTLDAGYVDVLDEFDKDQEDDDHDDGKGGSTAVVEMRFVPLERGLIRFGGVRILMLPCPAAEMEQLAPVEGSRNAETVWEASSLAEIWCQ